MLFVPAHSIVYHSSLCIGGVAIEVAPSDMGELSGLGTFIDTEADKAVVPTEETSAVVETKSAKSKARGDSRAKRAAKSTQKRN